MTAALYQIRKLNWRGWLSLIGLAALFLALRWNNFDAPLMRDEGEYAYSAQLLIQGVEPYQHAFIQKPPAVVYTYALCQLLLPHVFWSPRLLAAAAEALATVLLGLIARLEFGDGFALPTMWLATPLLLLPRMDQSFANVEMFMLLPLLGTLAIYSYSRQNGNARKHLFAAGFLAAATLLYKYTALPVLAFVFAVWWTEMFRRSGARTALLAAASAAAGGILASALALGFFLIHDGGRSWWECTIVFNRYYAMSSNFGFAYFWTECRNFWTSWWILFLIPWATLLRPQPRAWFWLGALICSILGTNAGCYGQYYVPVMPFWALSGVLGIEALCSFLSRRITRPLPLARALVTTAIVGLVILPDVPWMLYSPAQFVHAKMGESPFIEARMVADQVSRMSTPDDFVYVAGSEPEILYYARRFSPTRFITTYPLMIPTPLVAGYQREAIRDLQEHPPKLIVFVQTGNSWIRQASSPPEFLDFMGKFLDQRYKLAGSYVKAVPEGGYWTTNPSTTEYRKSSLLLYESKILAR